jgi:hypothetical protein
MNSKTTLKKATQKMKISDKQRKNSLDVRQDKAAINKKRMLECLEKTKGVVSLAAKECGIARWTHYTWMKEDPDYKDKAEEISNVAIDFAESSLFKQIEDGIPASTIFYLKTKGKRRGYVEDVNVNVQEQRIFPDKPMH